MAKIVISPLGGHGSGFLCDRLQASRVDTAFEFGMFNLRWIYNSMLKKPHPDCVRMWHKKAKIPLDLNKTMEENLLDCFNNTDDWMILHGVCSSCEPFLTRNRLQAYCIVRYPLDAYVSFFRNRHPSHAELFGGWDSEDAITHWARSWNNIVNDILQSGNPIIRYENFNEDCQDCDLSRAVKQDWFPGRRSHAGELSAENEALLMHLTYTNRKNIYGSTYE